MFKNRNRNQRCEKIETPVTAKMSAPASVTVTETEKMKDVDEDKDDDDDDCIVIFRPLLTHSHTF
jgi:hypothetical protein